MKRKMLYVVVGLACALALTAGSARADDGKRSVIVFTVQNLGDGSDACSGFGFSFEMVAPGDRRLGSGLSCVYAPPTCPPEPGCRDTVGALFALDFGRGTLTLPVVLNEMWLTNTRVLQLDHGTITAGSGDFAGATGSLDCFGTLLFTATGLTPRLQCVIHITS